MNRLLTTVFLIIIFGVTNAQELQPLDLVEKVFTNIDFAKNINSYSTGEYEGHPNVNDIQENTNLNFRLLNKTKNSAVVNITITDSLNSGIDTYIHLEKNKQWKIVAFRALAMTGMLKNIKAEFEKMTEKQIDSLIQSDNSETFNSKEDFYREIKNINLTLALDDTIIEHFIKNKNKFEKLKNELLNAKLIESERPYRILNIEGQIKTDYKNLLINAISKIYECENCFKFVIGGMIDNTVGYMYIPNKKDVPKMNPSRLIMLREIGDGWYLFKTT